jgi:hypothetical protein
VAPDHEVGALGCKWRNGEQPGENRCSAAHLVTSPIGSTASIPSHLPSDNARAKPNLAREQVCGIREGRLWVDSVEKV